MSHRSLIIDMIVFGLLGFITTFASISRIEHNKTQKIIEDLNNKVAQLEDQYSQLVEAIQPTSEGLYIDQPTASAVENTLRELVND